LDISWAKAIRFWLLFVALHLIFVFSGCGPNPMPKNQSSGGSINPEGTITLPSAPAEPLPTEEVTLPPPAVAATFSPPSTPVYKIPAAPETPTPQPTQLSTTTIDPTSTPIPPTFTPPPPPPVAEGEHLWFQRPVPGSSPSWTDKTYPYGSTRGDTLRPHTGVEFLVPEGTPILAVSPGTVRFAGNDSGVAYGPHPDFYGNLVIIEAQTTFGGLPVYQLYGHLSEVLVSEGQGVIAGEVIGLSGSTGVADGPHLHFEVRLAQNSYQSTRNPLLWLLPLPQTGVVLGQVVWPDGSPVYEAPVTLFRVDATSPYTATTTYAAGEPNQDHIFNENFAIDDVIPGYYEVIVGEGSNRISTEMWVYPGRTNSIEITLSP
jgi:murein DD-endopeptidase MepM/ murein hydrolase activator NlpD